MILLALPPQPPTTTNQWLQTKQKHDPTSVPSSHSIKITLATKNSFGKLCGNKNPPRCMWIVKNWWPKKPIKRTRVCATNQHTDTLPTPNNHQYRTPVPSMSLKSGPIRVQRFAITVVRCCTVWSTRGLSVQVKISTWFLFVPFFSYDVFCSFFSL